MDLHLSGKRALVTGGSGGIGAAIVTTLAREGAAVVVHGRDQDRAEQIAGRVRAAGGQAAVAVGDLSSDERAHQVAEAALGAFGGIDILINNAGAVGPGGWDQGSPQNWIDTYSNNAVAAVRLIVPLTTPMRERGWGRVIQIASVVATQPMAAQPHYAASKAALVNLSVSLAKQLAETGITVNTVSPGTIRTAGFDEAVKALAAERGWDGDDDEHARRALREVWPNPTGAFGTVDDVANLVAFVASPLAGFINGANLRVDGGNVASIN